MAPVILNSGVQPIKDLCIFHGTEISDGTRIVSKVIKNFTLLLCFPCRKPYCCAVGAVLVKHIFCNLEQIDIGDTAGISVLLLRNDGIRPDRLNSPIVVAQGSISDRIALFINLIRFAAGYFRPPRIRNDTPLADFIQQILSMPAFDHGHYEDISLRSAAHASVMSIVKGGRISAVTLVRGLHHLRQTQILQLYIELQCRRISGICKANLSIGVHGNNTAVGRRRHGCPMIVMCRDGICTFGKFSLHLAQIGLAVLIAPLAFHKHIRRGLLHTDALQIIPAVCQNVAVTDSIVGLSVHTALPSTCLRPEGTNLQLIYLIRDVSQIIACHHADEGGIADSQNIGIALTV